MTRTERCMLAAAWLLIAAAGAAGFWKVSQIPAIDPETAALCRTLRWQMAHGPVEIVPADLSLAALARQWGFAAEGRRPHPLSTTLLPRSLEEVRPEPIRDVVVQPFFATPHAEASLAGVALTWTRQRGEVDLKANERPKEVPPTGLRVWRSLGGAEWMEVAQLDAKATAWADVEAAPRTSYAYRVTLDAPDRARRAKDGPAAEARTPSDRRARLMGGDAKVAIMRVEAYNRKSGQWEGRTSTVRPGEELWPGGWRLTALKFRGFVLTAGVAAEDGRAVELTTRD